MIFQFRQAHWGAWPGQQDPVEPRDNLRFAIFIPVPLAKDSIHQNKYGQSTCCVSGTALGITHTIPSHPHNSLFLFPHP